MTNKPRTLFMGSPEFAVPTLSALLDAGYPVIGVVTQPDKPKGRSQKLSPPPVKVAAVERNLTVYQPKTLRDEAFASLLYELAPELIVVAAYGKILPQSVLDYPRYGCINVHASLLPLYRGADPIRRCILDGRGETGVTIMQMDAGCDTGCIIESLAVPILPDDTCDSLTARLSEAGAELLPRVLETVLDGTAAYTAQDDEKTCPAPKLSEEETVLNFRKPAAVCERVVRACMSAPVAETTLHGARLKITGAVAVDALPEGAVCRKNAAAGTVVATRKELFAVCSEGYLKITGVIPAGRKPMDAAAFLNGRGVAGGEKFGE